MSNLADSGSNDSDSNGDFEQLLPYPSISPQPSSQPSTLPERGETNLSGSPASTHSSPTVTPTHSMESKTYLENEPAATSKREADSSGQSCCCCAFSMLFILNFKIACVL